MLNRQSQPGFDSPTNLFMSQPTLPSLSSSHVGFAAGTASSSDESSKDEELRSLRVEVARCHALEAELMQLLGTKRVDRIVHDIRNLLQERIFLLAACRDSEEK
ncbi:hypothetical protein [Humisphaera borealis]|uniref:Uncharacterized protein n=1 Tax=Humisphaera borealis TaxID=2807512 RepID=A0A7M2WZU1_9BACT|nr:hypothetical protein [Humisphaera borealis]QOV91027.1 hypothetical protein IPV69_06610 [Humisphaera borealis]